MHENMYFDPKKSYSDPLKAGLYDALSSVRLRENNTVQQLRHPCLDPPLSLLKESGTEKNELIHLLATNAKPAPNSAARSAA